MTCALLRGDHFAAALISTMQALDGSKVSVSNTERSTVFDIIDRELNSWIHYGRPVEPRIQDLQDLRKQLVSDHVEQEARDILSVDLRCTPNLQEGSPAKDPDGAKRFIETLNANLLYHEYTFNTVLTQGSLPRQLSLREQTYLMPPGLVNDLNRYVAPEGYNWITGPNCFEMLPQPSELLYVKDPLVQSYIRSLGEPRSMIGHSPEAMRYIAGSAELLSNLKPFLNYKDRRSFSEASRLRACAASGESDPGPTVSEHYQSQNPYDYALSYLKEDGKNGQIDFDDPNTIDPFLPHQALAIHRHRQSIQSSKS
ncbi:hypothetical protein I302_106075 [Kwoniella bestiolae CBS 10118]|uniref:Uncharacterized protein n=1 Tax=Kwoniella bestiolae CBS 10118 TaxID=1296100 RepID=A0A1B9G2Y0_9TREE|nr:hypothetical protein I302_05201 [Kwoniella bestiolae CBS 10118]OCF25382.1 hypothetical protein I302_05201 [Kwoniella bestiolae CBS 10118]